MRSMTYICMGVLGMMVYLLFVPPTYSDDDYDWYMLDFRAFKRPCSIMAVCFYYRWKFIKLMVQLWDTEPDRIPYHTTKALQERRAETYRKAMERFARATTYQIYNISYHLYKNRRECSFTRIRRCEHELQADIYRHCTLTRKLRNHTNDTKCLQNTDLNDIDLYSMVIAYMGKGVFISALDAYRHISNNFRDVLIYSSHGTQLRLQRRTHAKWKIYEERTKKYYRNNFTSICEAEVKTICVYRKKAPGDVECYDDVLTNIPCWGQLSRPKFLRPNLKYGRGRDRLISAEIPPYLTPDLADNFD